MKKIFGLFLAIIILCCACTDKEEKLFKKLASSQTNITFKNQLRDTPELNILTYLYFYNGAGVAAGDFNNDHLIDLYFTSNQGADKLYINRGDLKFEDVTQISHIENTGNWTTGVTHVDINNDGLLDIYICKVGNYKEIKGRNLLYVNQGVNKEGVPTFKEDAASYGLAFSGFSTQASFFDYDLDGDLDMYLMNHSVHPNGNYGKGNRRKEIDSLSGDKLYKNNDGKFEDVTSRSGIYQGKIGYGLGLAISDLNNDGYPDIYVGNDFFENDYLYINQKDGTFKEIISLDDRKLGHTTHFSMGNDIADINNDGLTDLISLDMLPEDLETYKTSGLEYAFPIYKQYLKNGYAPQYMQNTLHLNLGGTNFSEIANLSGISATEWSWGALLADYDNDGHKDLFISNGIKGATNDMDFISFIANDNIQKRIDQGMNSEEMEFIDEIPEKKVPNYFFRNNGDLTFSDTTSDWYQKENSFSNGSVYADLDNDGDLDLIVNNVNDEAYVLENTSAGKTANNFLQVAFKGNKENPNGIGVRIYAYSKNGVISQENFITRGYLSSVANNIHMGIGRDSIIDSIQIIWPGGKHQSIKSVLAGNLMVNFKDAKGNFYEGLQNRTNFFELKLDTITDFTHEEQPTIEFNRDPLVPFANSNQGPSISVADINDDGLDDLFIGGAKRQASALFTQDASGRFTKVQENLFMEDAMSEDVSHVFFDANKDNTMDLLVVSGGNEFTSSERIKPRLYLNIDGVFEKDSTQFKTIEANASRVGTVDFDNDGDMDITIASDQIPQQFGKTSAQYLFRNDGNGNFEDVTNKICPACKEVGNVKDFSWVDLDNNGFKDLILVGHWMPVTIFMNTNGTLEKRTSSSSGLHKTNGWWNTLKIEDFDKDGDMDMIAGNWGINSKFTASSQKPITLYSNDFDNNGSIEPLVTYFYKEKETPFASKDELVKQMPFLNKKFLSYQSFASADMNGLFAVEKLDKAYKKEVFELASCYFENDGNGHFIKKELPLIAQASTIRDIGIEDFDKDGFLDVILVGNDYEISTQLGRMDASHGVLLRFVENGFQWAKDWKVDISGPARSIAKITIKDSEGYIIGVNNNKPLFISIPTE